MASHSHRVFVAHLADKYGGGLLVRIGQISGLLPYENGRFRVALCPFSGGGVG